MHAASQCNTVLCQRIRVLVVDEHWGVRRAIATLISTLDDMELAGEAASVEEALSLCACSLPPDVALMATAIHGISAAGACRTLHERWPAVRILGMSTFQEEDRVPGILAAGAVGCLLKNLSGEELASAIRRAHAA